MVYKILENRWVKIRLQNTVGTIHGAESSYMQNLIATAGIITGARTFFDKSTLVSCKKENLLSLPYRIISLGYGTINLFYITNC